LSKVFACGVGYPVRTKDGSQGNVDASKSNNGVRADSFSLYMNVVGDLILKNLLPKGKLQNLPHIEVLRDAFLANATYEQY
jgi:hypothetical protein